MSSPGLDSRASSAAARPSAVKENKLPKRNSLEQTLGIIAVILDVILIVFAVIEIGPRFIPNPALVWAADTDEGPGFKTVTVAFRNPSDSFPLQNLQAHWSLQGLGVKLTVQQGAPSYVVDDSLPTEKSLKTTGDLPAGTKFKAYLHADQAFQVTEQDFRAVVPKISEFSTYTIPADVINERDWESKKESAYWILLHAFLLLAAAIWTIHKLSSTARNWFVQKTRRHA